MCAQRKIAEGRGICGGCCGSLAGNQVEASDLVPFCVIGDQLNAAVKLIDNIENFFVNAFSGGGFQQQSADLQVQCNLLPLRYQRVGSLLHTVVQKVETVCRRMQ